MKFSVPCLDGSVRELETQDIKPFMARGFSAEYPVVGQYFYFFRYLWLRTAAKERPDFNVLCVSFGGTDSVPIWDVGRLYAFTRDRESQYIPVDIWTGEWL